MRALRTTGSMPPSLHIDWLAYRSDGIHAPAGRRVTFAVVLLLAPGLLGGCALRGPVPVVDWTARA